MSGLAASEVLKTQQIQLKDSTDVVLIRQGVRALAVEVGFSLVDQTKVITAASELARNTIIYGLGGMGDLQIIEENGRKGIRAIFEDHGPGIRDIEQALSDGFTSGTGLGLGLGGAKRLCSEFQIESVVGQGTKVTIVKWKG